MFALRRIPIPIRARIAPPKKVVTGWVRNEIIVYKKELGLIP
tara:strand:+ start:9630 stop:9755 length:126 start_codon:yes stop_codon:yes gene_type:complete